MAMNLSDKKIVVIGGGTGIFSVLVGLRKYFSNITSVVTMADDGGSAGILREDFGILPPGDVRRSLVALSETDDKILSNLFTYRFSEGKGLAGHSFGNLMLTALERITGSFEKAIEEAGKILRTKGQVIPVTLSDVHLCAELENGQIIKGEANIDVPSHDGRIRIKKIWLSSLAKINPKAKRAILEADLVIMGPGDLYTSIIPNILVGGVPEALNKTKASVLYISNLMTKYGETNNFSAYDFLSAIENYLRPGTIDYFLANSKKPTPARLKKYAAQHSVFVEIDKEKFKNKPVLVIGDYLRKNGFIRHDPEKTARTILHLI